MADTYCEEDYLPWLLAHDYGLQPSPDTFSEIWDRGSDVYDVTLANETQKTNIIVQFNNDRPP